MASESLTTPNCRMQVATAFQKDAGLLLELALNRGWSGLPSLQSSSSSNC